MAYLKKISLIFTDFLVNLLKLFGALKSDEQSIAELKNNVHDFYFNQAQVHRQNDMQRLQEASQQIVQENENLVQRKNQIVSQISNCEDQKRALVIEKAVIETDVDNIRHEFLAAQTVIGQKQTAEQEIINLNRIKDQLELELIALNRKKENLLPARAELADLEMQIGILRADIDQIKNQSVINKHNNLSLEFISLKVRDILP
ncbi:MAG: hypothetical protein H0V82_10490 [Candidatus Protochlamydia sp.]|nr:hypothetical protein [Candidatus Protochlamydia sp.]